MAGRNYVLVGAAGPTGGTLSKAEQLASAPWQCVGGQVQLQASSMWPACTFMLLAATRH